MTPETLDLMQREKLTKMVVKDYYLDNRSNDSLLRIADASVLSEISVLDEVVFAELLRDLVSDPLFAGPRN